MFDFLKSSTHKDLEFYLTSLKLDESNNYKDAAQDDFKKLCETYDALSSAGKLNSKQKDNYKSVIDYYREKLVGFTHKDQKPYWTDKK
ncbi:MAG: hypothetical protein K5848_02965 [Lachnospiraceae bacterium]|nr:hypothetical protein [Lachnospiraceae bacterium]